MLTETNAHRRAMLSCAVAFFFAAPIAHAAPNADEQVAQTLFDAARGHLASGEVARACAEFEQSYKIDAAGGTLLNLAYCHERQGKLATALTEYKTALAQAKRDGRADRTKTAVERIADLSTRVPQWTVAPPPGNYEALAITIDGVPYAFDVLGNDTPFDPGAHVIHVTATGRVSRDVKLVAREGVRERIAIPPLESDGTAAAPAGAPLTLSPSEAPPVNVEPAQNVAFPPPAPTEPRPAQTQEGGSFGPVHYTLFISSGALLVATGILGGIALNDSSQVSSDCIKSRDYCHDQSSLDNVSNMRSFAIASTVTLGAAVVAAGVGLYLWPRKKWVTAEFRGNSLFFSGSF